MRGLGLTIIIQHRGKTMISWIKTITKTIGMILLLALASGLIAAVFFTENPDSLF